MVVVAPLMKKSLICLMVSQILVVPETVQAARLTVDAVPAAVRLLLDIRYTLREEATRPFVEAKRAGLSMAFVEMAVVVATLTLHFPSVMLFISLRAVAVQPPWLLLCGRAMKVVLAARLRT